MLRLEQLTKTYPTGDKALNAVDLEVPEGQVLALIGPSGAGKSTLIRCINRLVEPTSGKIFLEDINLAKLGGAALRRERRRMGMIFQEYALVERLTVMENVLSGRLGYVGFWGSWARKFPQRDVDEAFRLLDRVGLLDMADKRADELSGVKIHDNGDAEITMTLTAPACPVAGEMPGEVSQKVAGVFGIGEVETILTWEPPWTKDMMSEDAKLALGFF